MFAFVGLLKDLNRVSGAVDTVIHDPDPVRKKAALVTIITTGLGMVEKKMKKDLANDAKVKVAAEHLAEAVFTAMESVEPTTQ